MADNGKKKTAPKKAAKKAAPKKEKKLEFGVAYLADKLDLEPGTVRIKLRDLDVAKTGKSYGWSTQAEADKIVKQLSA